MEHTEIGERLQKLLGLTDREILVVPSGVVIVLGHYEATDLIERLESLPTIGADEEEG